MRHIGLLIVMPFILAALVFFATQDQPQTFKSKTRVYTGIATGSSIVSLEDAKFDLFATRAAFDNLINIINSRSTLEEVSVRLLASHLILSEAKEEIISAKSLRETKGIVPEEVMRLVVPNNLDKTVSNFKKYRDANHTNFLYELVNYNHPYYSSRKIGAQIKVMRVQSSDLIEVSYASSDPGVCKNTLQILVDVFIQEYTGVKVNQSDAVVAYFNNQLVHADQKLNKAEQELLQFNQSNTIINYYEQTKHIASEKEHFDLAYQELMRDNVGAYSVIAILEDKMSVRQKQFVNNTKIMDLRDELSKINGAIALKTYQEATDSIDEQNLIEEIAELRHHSALIQEELSNAINTQYIQENSDEGAPTDAILEEWLTKVIELESTKAKLKVGDIQKKEYNKLFSDYAPLGATMKRLERKIDVAEREYLSILHSLGLAKLKQQNIEMNSNLHVVSPPLFPIVAEPSKRKFLIAIAFMIGFIIPAFVIIVLDFLNTNIRTAERAEAFIGLKVAAIFPKIKGVSKKIDIEFIKKRGIDVIARRLILNTEKAKDKNKPDINLFFSSLDGEGKSTLLKLLLKKLAGVGYKVLYVTFDKTEEIEGIDTYGYTITKAFHRAEKISDLVPELNAGDLERYNYVFLEIPGILNHTYPINLFKTTDNSFIVTRANRSWNKSDSYSLQDIVEYSENKPQVLLNGVELVEMENVIGELPRERSFLRSILKSVIKFQFFSKRDLINKKKKNFLSNNFLLFLIPIIILPTLLINGGKSSNEENIWKTDNERLEYVPMLLNEQIDEDIQLINIDTLNYRVEKLDSSESFHELGSEFVQPISKYYLIGGSFSLKENAIAFHTRLQNIGFTPEYIKRDTNLHTVAIGIYKNYKEAQMVLDQYLQLNPESDAWIFNGDLGKK